MKRRSLTGTKWSAADLLTLRREWHQVCARTLGQKLRRSWCAIYVRAQAEGLPLGIPQGCLSVTAAAGRLGVHPLTLRGILARAGVRVRTAYPSTKRSRATGKTRSPVWHYVDEHEAQEAFEAWMGTESVRGAAIARGWSAAGLRKRLIAAGVYEPGTKRGAGPRVPTEVIDRVLAGHPRRAAA